MDERQRLLVEGELYKAISAFHDCDDKKTREKYVKEYTLEFCKKYGIDVMEALDIVIEIINNRRQNSQYKYEHYKDLKKIVMPPEKKSKSKTTLKKKPETPEDSGR